MDQKQNIFDEIKKMALLQEKELNELQLKCDQELNELKKKLNNNANNIAENNSDDNVAEVFQKFENMLIKKQKTLQQKHSKEQELILDSVKQQSVSKNAMTEPKSKTNQNESRTAFPRNGKKLYNLTETMKQL